MRTGRTFEQRKLDDAKLKGRITQRVHDCGQAADIGDYQSVHITEKQAWEDALYFIAMRNPTAEAAAQIAAEALKTVDIDFPRYYT